MVSSRAVDTRPPGVQWSHQKNDRPDTIRLRSHLPLSSFRVENDRVAVRVVPARLPLFDFTPAQSRNTTFCDTIGIRQLEICQPVIRQLVIRQLDIRQLSSTPHRPPECQSICSERLRTWRGTRKSSLPKLDHSQLQPAPLLCRKSTLNPNSCLCTIATLKSASSLQTTSKALATYTAIPNGQSLCACMEVCFRS